MEDWSEGIGLAVELVEGLTARKMEAALTDAARTMAKMKIPLVANNMV